MQAIIEDWYPVEPFVKSSPESKAIPHTCIIKTNDSWENGTTESLSTHLIQIEDCTVRFAHITITQDILVKESGKLILEECVFMPKYRSHVAAIDVSDQSELEVTNSHLFNTTGMTIRVSSHSKCGLYTTIFAGDGHMSLMVTATSLCEMDKCYFNGANYGIFVQDNGETRCNNCEFLNCNNIPIIAVNGGVALVNTSVFTNCKKGAVSIVEKGTCEFSGCSFTNTKGNLVTARNNGNLMMHKCNISKTEGNCVIASNKSKVNVSNSTFTESQYPAIALNGSQANIKNCDIMDMTGRGIVCFNNGILEMQESTVFSKTIGVFASDEAQVVITKCKIFGEEAGISSQDGASTTIKQSKISSDNIGIVGLTEGHITADDCDLTNCGKLSIHLHHGAFGYFANNKIKPEIEIEDSDLNAFLQNQSPTGQDIHSPRVVSPKRSPQVFKSYEYIIMPCGHAWKGPVPTTCLMCGSEVEKVIKISVKRDVCALCKSKPTNCVGIPCGHCLTCSDCTKRESGTQNFCLQCKERVDDFRILRWQGTDVFSPVAPYSPISPPIERVKTQEMRAMSSDE